MQLKTLTLFSCHGSVAYIWAYENKDRCKEKLNLMILRKKF